VAGLAIAGQSLRCMEVILGGPWRKGQWRGATGAASLTPASLWSAALGIAA
jgi:hypothetical protein